MIRTKKEKELKQCSNKLDLNLLVIPDLNNEKDLSKNILLYLFYKII
jgi:hypothetical protein